MTVISADWLRGRRWFAGKSRTIEGVRVADEIPLGPLTLAIVEVAYASGAAERYLVGLMPDREGDAFDRPECQEHLFRLMSQAAKCGPVRFDPLDALPAQPGPSKLLGAEQSNTSIVYGRDWVLKLFRRLETGENRDLEMGRFLSLDAGFPYTPRIGGAIVYRDNVTLGVLQRFVPNHGDCWTYLRAQLDALVEEVPNAPDDVYWAQDGLPDRSQPLLAHVEQLGRVSGEMHRALASRPDLPDFAAEPCTTADLESWRADLEAQGGDASLVSLQLTSVEVAHIPKIQIHGDYHLGQVLETDEGFAIIDFEGEPARPLAARRAKQPAMRDVAGMLRSLHYVAWATALNAPEGQLDGWAEAWAGLAGDRFITGWRTTSGQPLEPELLRLFQLAKAYYELDYERNNRPDWVQVPLRGIRALTRHD